MNGLGDQIEFALSSIGITEDRVSRWLGRPCNCQERIEKLNALSQWAGRIVKGKTDKATEYLENILKD